LIYDGLFRFDRLQQGAPLFTYTGFKNFPAISSYGLILANSGYLLGGSIKRGNLSVQIDGKNAVGDTVQYYLGLVLKGFFHVITVNLVLSVVNSIHSPPSAQTSIVFIFYLRPFGIIILNRL
jgi:hypothetical protein